MRLRDGRLRRSVVTGVAATLVVLVMAGSADWPPEARAQAAMPAPPEIAEPFLVDPLTSETLFTAGACPTGRAHGHYVDEGFRLEVTGTCRPDAAVADVAVLGRGIELPDGDVSVAFKVVGGAARAGLSLYARIAGRNTVGAYVNQGSGEVTIFKTVDGQWSGLGTRTDGRYLLHLDDWNRLGLRLVGGAAWLMVNDEPVIYTLELTPGTGSIGLRLVREGRVDDTEPVAVVFADLRVSGLAEGGSYGAPAAP